MSGNFKEGYFPASKLRIVAKAPAPDAPPLIVGDFCQLNSGSPAFLIVDSEDNSVTVAWRFEDRVIERILPRACVQRARGD